MELKKDIKLSIVCSQFGISKKKLIDNLIKNEVDYFSIGEEIFINRYQLAELYKSDEFYDSNYSDKKYRSKYINILLKGTKEERNQIEVEKYRLSLIHQKEIYNEKIRMSSEKISNLIKDSFYINNVGKYIIHVGPTSSGKTYHATEAIKKSNNQCAYLSPLRLLAWEVYEKLKDTKNGCNLVTGEDLIDNNSIVTSSTIEMCDYNKDYDIVVIDETFMIGDEFRGKSWMKAILTLKANEVHLILNDESIELIISLLEKTGREYIINRYTRKVPIFFSDKEVDIENLPEKTIIVVFSRKSCILMKAKLESKGIKTSILYGNLPPETKKSQIQKFISGENKICVSTDVIGMGINVPCDYVCFEQISKYDGNINRELNSIEVRQIGGRAGRYLLSDKGIITATNKENLEYLKETYEEPYWIDNGYYAIDEWMLEYLKGDNMMEKLEFFTELDIIPDELKEIIKKQSIENYIEILAINKNIYELDEKIIWKLINLAVSKNNSNYFSQIVDSLIKNEEILPPEVNTYHIYDTEDLSDAEDKCKEIDLYLSAIRNNTLKNFFKNEEDLLVYQREELIGLIDNYLVRQKINMKTCISCKDPMEISSKFKYCDRCYKKRKSEKNNKLYDFSKKYDIDDENFWN